MKKYALSLAALMAMSTLAIADEGLYAGIAYGSVNTEADSRNLTETISADIDHDTFMLQAGYKFNPYLAVEARVWYAVGDSDLDFSYTDSEFPQDNESGSESIGDDSNVWGIYLKPMYPVSEAFDVYALLGYALVELDLEGFNSADEGQFQWGLGASYDVNNNFAVFVDYVAMYDDDQKIDYIPGDATIDSWNFGVTYKF